MPTPYIAPVVDTSQSEQYLQNLATKWIEQEEQFASTPLIVQEKFSAAPMHPVDKQKMAPVISDSLENLQQTVESQYGGSWRKARKYVTNELAKLNNNINIASVNWETSKPYHQAVISGDLMGIDDNDYFTQGTFDVDQNGNLVQARGIDPNKYLSRTAYQKWEDELFKNLKPQERLDYLDLDGIKVEGQISEINRDMIKKAVDEYDIEMMPKKIKNFLTNRYLSANQGLTQEDISDEDLRSALAEKNYDRTRYNIAPNWGAYNARLRESMKGSAGGGTPEASGFTKIDQITQQSGMFSSKKEADKALEEAVSSGNTEEAKKIKSVIDNKTYSVIGKDDKLRQIYQDKPYIQMTEEYEEVLGPHVASSQGKLLKDINEKANKLKNAKYFIRTPDDYAYSLLKDYGLEENENIRNLVGNYFKDYTDWYNAGGKEIDAATEEAFKTETYDYNLYAPNSKEDRLDVVDYIENTVGLENFIPVGDNSYLNSDGKIAKGYKDWNVSNVGIVQGGQGLPPRLKIQLSDKDNKEKESFIVDFNKGVHTDIVRDIAFRAGKPEIFLQFLSDTLLDNKVLEDGVNGKELFGTDEAEKYTLQKSGNSYNVIDNETGSVLQSFNSDYSALENIMSRLGDSYLFDYFKYKARETTSTDKEHKYYLGALNFLEQNLQ